jgi:hypothetical protein
MHTILQLSYKPENHSRSIQETKHKNRQTPEVPWKPQCGENQQRGAFIEALEEYYSN